MIPLIFDTDQHITPPPDLWTSRMPKKYQDVAPRVIDLPDGTQAWSVEGGGDVILFGLQNVEGLDASSFSWRTRYKDIRPAAYEPKARLKTMDIDGVRATLLFPSATRFGNIQDDDLYAECIRVYNDGVWDWARDGDPRRIHPAAQVPCRDLETALGELDRVAKKGFKHFQYSGSPGGSEYLSPADDPFWALAQETGMVVSMHGAGGAGRPRGRRPEVPPLRQVSAQERGPGGEVPTGEAPRKAAAPIPMSAHNEPHGASRARGLGAPPALGLMATTGVLERFPDLKLGLIETSAGWLPSFLERLDAAYAQYRWMGARPLAHLPSEYIRRQAWISVDRERQGIKHRDWIGSDRLMFGTDFPHSSNFHPHTRQYIDLLFDGVPDDETNAILWSNGAALYGVD